MYLGTGDVVHVESEENVVHDPIKAEGTDVATLGYNYKNPLGDPIDSFEADVEKGMANGAFPTTFGSRGN